MKPDVSDLLEKAMKLPSEARAALASSLIDSLDEEVDENVEEAWKTEIQERLKQIDAGTVELVPWAEVRKKLTKP